MSVDCVNNINDDIIENNLEKILKQLFSKKENVSLKFDSDQNYVDLVKNQMKNQMKNQIKNNLNEKFKDNTFNKVNSFIKSLNTKKSAVNISSNNGSFLDIFNKPTKPNLNLTSIGGSENGVQLAIQEIFNVKNSKLNEIEPIAPVIKSNVTNFKKGSYSTNFDYPNTYGQIDEVGNFYKINKKEGLLEYRHQSGTNIKINKNGDVSLIINGTTKIISQKDLMLNVKGNMDLVIDNEYNVKCKNYTIKSDNNTFKCSKNHNIECNKYSSSSAGSSINMSGTINMKSQQVNLKAPMVKTSKNVYVGKDCSAISFTKR